ncbi:B3 domain-containing transcription factor VRN1-like isoform X2 [Rhodamnia argentea]|uniref:B3 domain-containing transcription factor VRN1-like isoform X2 n=1 Tax=Rhodamnia argentea TaxID=178133 RepID=A0ABM3HD35_9MYRT|nr:B3 domain-containing transcription factor VRN1-like isoform X2 [Rhodamnia argentea]
MACGRRRPREDGGVEPHIATGPRLESPHFFKIILSDTLQSGKLGIPKKFFGRYGKDLSSLVLLKVPASSTWTIGLEKRNNGTLWLWKGWREFMQHYSIGLGHLVVFKYKGNSTFCVMIFDKSASEINYSSSGLSNLRSGFISPKREDVVEVEDSEDSAPHQKMRVEPHSPCSQPSPSCSSRDLEGRTKQSRCRMDHSEPVLRDPTLPRPLTTPELASEFDSEHPFFKMAIRQSHLKALAPYSRKQENCSSYVYRQIVASEAFKIYAGHPSVVLCWLGCICKRNSFACRKCLHV